MKRKKTKRSAPRVKKYDTYDLLTAIECEIHEGLEEAYKLRPESAADKVNVTEVNRLAGIAHQKLKLHHAALADSITEEVMRHVALKVAVAQLLYFRLASKATTPQAAFKEMWAAEGDAAIMASECTREGWRITVVKAVEYLLCNMARLYIDLTSGGAMERAAQVELKIRPMLRELDPGRLLKGHFNPRFLSSMCCVVAKMQEYKEEDTSEGFILEKGSPEAEFLDKLTGQGAHADALENPVYTPSDKLDEITYRIPANYWSWKQVKNFIRAGHMSDLASAYPLLSKEDLQFFRVFAECGDNFYMVGEQFLHELEDTDLLVEDLNINEEAPLPHPAFLWLLPKGALMVPKLGEHENLTISAVMIRGDDKELFIGCFYAPVDQSRMAHVSAVFSYNTDGTLSDVAREFSSSYGNGDGFSGDALWFSSLVKTVMKILVSMAAEPKIVECEVTESVRPAKKDKRRLEFRVPRVVGWKVRYIRTGGSKRKRKLEKGHVEPHWRRRHIKRLPYGPKSVPLSERPRRIVVIPRTRVNSEYEKAST